ncbi:MAG: hypothetical protein LBU21_05400 [Treponema sp.]|jgi:hypothetical protein|nr:hypothetical protein [Treponema sp.]
MNDIMPEGPVPTNTLAKQGVAAIGNLIGGAGLLILGALPPIVGIIAGAVAGIVGIVAVLSGDPEDRKPGIIITIAGALAILSKVGIVRPLAGTLLGIGALGLLALGIRHGIRFLRGLKSRS